MTSLHRVSRLDLSLVPFTWPFAADNRAKIADHFSAVQAAKPEVWNGTCLQYRNPRIEDDAFRADYFAADYASFLAWRDWNVFDGEVFHCFSGGALQSADGAFILGRMSEHTANAGRVYSRQARLTHRILSTRASISQRALSGRWARKQD
jgi:hypothetical protein